MTSDLFKCFCPQCERLAGAQGFDFAVLRLAPCACATACAALTGRTWCASSPTAAPDGRARPAAGGPGTSSSGCASRRCRWKRSSAASYGAVHAIRPDLKLGVGSRTAAFAPLTGYHQRRLAPISDYQSPKLYFWMNGYDGFYGDGDRGRVRCNTSCPAPRNTLCLEAVRALFGTALPEVTRFADLRAGFPDAFFTELVAGEVAKMLERAGGSRTAPPVGRPGRARWRLPPAR